MSLPLYLLRQCGEALIDFIRHWYLDAPRRYAHHVVNFLETCDRTLAFRVTWRHFFEPLYHDESAVGYAIDIPFRFVRLAIGGVFYAAFIALAFVPFLLWIAIPPYLALKIVTPLLPGLLA